MQEQIFHLGVKALIFNHQGQILLLKVNQNNFTEVQEEDYWDLPGGRVLEGHTSEETLKREIKEETGLERIELGQCLGMTLSNMRIPLKNGIKAGLVVAVYVCPMTVDAAIQISKEHHDFKWVEPHEGAQLLSIKYPKDFFEKLLITA